MGGGSYSSVRYMADTTARGYDYKSTEEIFTQRNINNAMSPFGLKVRESRDSAEHPESFPIIIALDVTGSMGSVPHYIVKDGLPKIMDSIIQGGIKDPQVMFMGIGDHECDSAPLQVGQFESSDELLGKWLTSVYLEGGGGGNAGESYCLAWYLAGKHTSTDHFEKRGKKGILFTIGDEPTLEKIPSYKLKNIMGDGQYEDYDTSKLMDEASKKWDIFHININQTYSGGRAMVQNHWKEKLHENALFASRQEDVSKIIADKVLEVFKKQGNEKSVEGYEDETSTKSTSIKQDIIL